MCALCQLGRSRFKLYVAGRVTGLATAGDCLVVVDNAGDLTMNCLFNNIMCCYCVVKPLRACVLCEWEQPRLKVRCWESDGTGYGR